MSDTNPQVIEKVKKLLNLANNAGATEAEAATAMGRVQTILAAHNLTLAQVEADTAAGPAQRDKIELQGRAAYQYQRDLMAAIAEANFCLWWLDHDYTWSETSERYLKKPKHMLVGRQHNVIAAQNMFDYLNSTLERLSKTAISWKEGATARLRSRLRDRTRELINENHHKTQEAQASQPTGDGTSVAIRLENVFEQESDANWEFRFGYEPGALAKMRAERAAQEETKVKEQAKPETAAEKAKREEKARKYWERVERKAQKAWEAKDHEAYMAGMETGDKIGLDDQIADRKTTQGKIK